MMFEWDASREQESSIAEIVLFIYLALDLTELGLRDEVRNQWSSSLWKGGGF